MRIYNTTHHNCTVVSWTGLIKNVRKCFSCGRGGGGAHVAQLSMEGKRGGRMKGGLGGRVGVGSSLPTSDALVESVSAQR